MGKWNLIWHRMAVTGTLPASCSPVKEACKRISAIAVVVEVFKNKQPSTLQFNGTDKKFSEMLLLMISLCSSKWVLNSIWLCEVGSQRPRWILDSTIRTRLWRIIYASHSRWNALRRIDLSRHSSKNVSLHATWIQRPSKVQCKRLLLQSGHKHKNFKLTIILTTCLPLFKLSQSQQALEFLLNSQRQLYATGQVWQQRGNTT